MELIDRQAFINYLTNSLKVAYPNEFTGLIVALETAQRFPAVYAVPVMPEGVVRCKDCKHLYDRIGYYCCRNHSGLARISEDSFCSYGERSGKT